MPSGVFIKETNCILFFQKGLLANKIITKCTQGQMIAFPSVSSSEMKFVGIMKRGIKS